MPAPAGFNDRNARGPGAAAPRGFQNQGNANFGGGRDEGAYSRKPGWGDSAPRGNAGGAPRGDGFAPRGHAGGGKVFVPRDAQKRGFKPTR